MVELIEDYYGHDGQTAYIMTSDHGMTNWGSHGAGHAHETLTPLVAWGGGIRGAVISTEHEDTDGLSTHWKLDHLKRSDVSQADIAPLMTSLIGEFSSLTLLRPPPHECFFVLKMLPTFFHFHKNILSTLVKPFQIVSTCTRYHFQNT